MAKKDLALAVLRQAVEDYQLTEEDFAQEDNLYTVLRDKTHAKHFLQGKKELYDWRASLQLWCDMAEVDIDWVRNKAKGLPY